MGSTQKAPDWPALAGTAITIAVHMAMTAAGRAPSAIFIGGACLVWTVYLAVRFFRTPSILHEWGFRTDNLREAIVLPIFFLLAGASAMALYAQIHGSLRFPWHTWVLLLIYPAWGLIQQFLALGIVVNNLERVPWLGDRPALIVGICAGLFGLIHAYDAKLVVGTSVLEVGLILLFLRSRNLWPLGFLHGWLGGLFYLWVLNEDLWAKIFGG